MTEEYKIIIENKTEKEPPIKAVSGTNGGGSLGGETEGGGSKTADYVLSRAKKLVSVGAIVQTVDQIVSHQNSLISLRTGQQEYAQRANYAYQKTSGFVKSVAMGAISGGMAAGLPGALVGALFGGAMNVGGNVMNYLFAQDTVKTQKSLEDMSRSMRSMRATTSGRRYSNITEF